MNSRKPWRNDISETLRSLSKSASNDIYELKGRHDSLLVFVEERKMKMGGSDRGRGLLDSMRVILLPPG